MLDDPSHDLSDVWNVCALVSAPKRDFTGGDTENAQRSIASFMSFCSDADGNRCAYAVRSVPLLSRALVENTSGSVPALVAFPSRGAEFWWMVPSTPPNREHYYFILLRPYQPFDESIG